MSGQNDARLLFSQSGIKAYHLQNGHEDDLTPSGSQTLSLLMVPTSSPFADPLLPHQQPEHAEEDFYLHLNLPPELDLPLPATTQIYHQPPRSYLIPRWDLGPESGAFTRIEFPPLGAGPGFVTQEDVDTFETILAQCTAFLERATAPTSEKGGLSSVAYNPADYKPGEAYAAGTARPGGHIVLIDEENGSVVGQLAEGAMIHEDPGIKPGSKNPVEIQIGENNQVDVRPVDEDYLSMANHPAYKGSSIVQNAAAASRLIVTGSTYLSNAMTSSATNFTTKTQPNPEPMKFKPATQANLRRIHTLTQGASTLSAKTVGQVSKVAQGIGASMSGRGPKSRKGFDKDGKPISDYKPGVLNKSLIAFSTIADGIAYSGKNILTSSSTAATQVVSHRWGPEAGQATAQLAGGIKHVGLVYIDVTGVSRRAVVKGVAKGMVVGRVDGGGQVVVGGGDGGDIPPEDLKQANLYDGSVKGSEYGGGSAPPSYYGPPGGGGGGGASSHGALPSKH